MTYYKHNKNIPFFRLKLMPRLHLTVLTTRNEQHESTFLEAFLSVPGCQTCMYKRGIILPCSVAVWPLQQPNIFLCTSTSRRLDPNMVNSVKCLSEFRMIK